MIIDVGSVTNRSGTTVSSKCIRLSHAMQYVEFMTALPKTRANEVQKHMFRSKLFTPTAWDHNDQRARWYA